MAITLYRLLMGVRKVSMRSDGNMQFQGERMRYARGGNSVEIELELGEDDDFAKLAKEWVNTERRNQQPDTILVMQQADRMAQQMAGLETERDMLRQQVRELEQERLRLGRELELERQRRAAAEDLRRPSPPIDRPSWGSYAGAMAHAEYQRALGETDRQIQARIMAGLSARDPAASVLRRELGLELPPAPPRSFAQVAEEAQVAAELERQRERNAPQLGPHPYVPRGNGYQAVEDIAQYYLRQEAQLAQLRREQHELALAAERERLELEEAERRRRWVIRD